MNVYDLLIVGNGYDLACNYKTSFQDFLDYIMNEKRTNNTLIHYYSIAQDYYYFENNEWNSFEKFLCQYLQYLYFLFTDDTFIKNREFPKGYSIPMGMASSCYLFTINNIMQLPQNIFAFLKLRNPFDSVIRFFEDKNYTKPFTGFNNTPHIPETIYVKVTLKEFKANPSIEDAMSIVLEELNKMLTNMEQELKQYIQRATSNATNKSNPLLDCSAKRIISFNYSLSAQKHFVLNDSQIAYVHGNINSRIVIGVEPNMINHQSFGEESLFMPFFKRFRRIFNDCNKNYNSKIIYHLEKNSIIGIYGHSLDLADKSILKPIFEKKYQRYDIYCYGNVDDYKLKISKLIGLDLYDELEKDGRISLIPVND